MKIYLAPLQEYTEYSYRNAIHKHLNYFDKYFIPYISYPKGDKLKNRQKRDIEIVNNQFDHIVPQILAANKEEVEYLLPFLEEYNEVNINFGCPYPMVTKRGRGCGIYQDLEKAKEVIETTLNNFKGKVSVKLRSGLKSHDSWVKMIELLNQYNLEEIIIHPRTASQLYKGEPEYSYLSDLIDLSTNPVVYNGDIMTIADYNHLIEQYPNLSGVMLGRGALTDIYLAQRIKEKRTTESLTTLIEIHNEVFEEVRKQTEIERQVIQKMERFWDYFSHHFENERKVYKNFKKSKNQLDYNTALSFAKRQGIKKRES
ncbi:MAG: tRNA-dihydrouridine synthase [Prolixibacteraceae bacterium]